MKVLIFNTRVDSMQNWGGDTTQVIETEKALHALGVETEISLNQPINIDKYDVIHIFNLQTIESAVNITKLANSKNKPIVLSTIYWDMRYICDEDFIKYCAGRVYEAISRISPKLSLHVYNLRYSYGNLKKKNVQRIVLDEVDLILPNSVAELEILVQEFNMPALRARSLIVPNAVSYEKEMALDKGPSNHDLPLQYVLMAASFHPVKGQHRLIEALNDNKEIPIVFVGRIDKESIYGRYCMQLAKQRGNTFILGVVDHANMPPLYSRAKVHALPSLRESPGLASLEAAIHDANCVVSIHAPVWEYFKNEAFVCDPLDSNSIKEAVLDAWRSEQRSELKKMILKEFTWAKAAEITLQAYERAIRHQ